MLTRICAKSGGEKTYQIFHTANNPKNLVLLFEWDNLENGRQFVKSKELRQAMREAGVSDKPEFYFLEKGEQGSV